MASSSVRLANFLYLLLQDSDEPGFLFIDLYLVAPAGRMLLGDVQNERFVALLRSTEPAGGAESMITDVRILGHRKYSL